MKKSLPVTFEKLLLHWLLADRNVCPTINKNLLSVVQTLLSVKSGLSAKSGRIQQSLLAAIVVIFLAVLLSACPAVKPPTVEPADGVVLRYKYPAGQKVRYRTQSKTRMSFTIPFISDPQHIRSETVVDIVEEVLQESIGGYAIIEQRVVSMVFQLYKGHRIVFDSTRPGEFPPQANLEALANVRGTSIRYEINDLGDIRRAEGLEEIADIMGSGAMSRVYQGAQPVLPEAPVSVGGYWESSREVPLTPGKGYQGTMEIIDRSELQEIKNEGGSRQAVFKLKRTLKIRLYTATTSGKAGKSTVKGDGQIIATITFDIDRGIVLTNNGRMKITTSAAVSDQPFVSNLILDIDGLYNTAIVE